MRYFIDSADHEEIEKWANILGDSFAGVTTNLTMLVGEGEISKFLLGIKENYKTVMFQVEDLCDASPILNAVGDMIQVAKVSMIEKNFKMISQLKALGATVAATTCYSIIQINQAIELGMDYSMVYYAKNNYKGLLETAYQLKRDSGSNIGLVAASIHTPVEVIHAIKSGMDYATVRPDVLELLFNDPQALADIERVANG